MATAPGREVPREGVGRHLRWSEGGGRAEVRGQTETAVVTAVVAAVVTAAEVVVIVTVGTAAMATAEV